MKEQLIHYVDLLFAGAENAGDIKQEILQNTLDRYDDLIAQGKAPQAAYSLAISGIGDISELLGSNQSKTAGTNPPIPIGSANKSKPLWKKIVTAVAISLYIICVIPLIILSEMGMDVIGLCGTLSIVAVATVAIILASDDKGEKEVQSETEAPVHALKKAVKSTVTTIGLVAYFVISFLTQAWHITWLVFPIMAAIRGLVNACIDLREAKKHEK